MAAAAALLRYSCLWLGALISASYCERALGSVESDDMFSAWAYSSSMLRGARGGAAADDAIDAAGVAAEGPGMCIASW